MTKEVEARLLTAPKTISLALMSAIAAALGLAACLNATEARAASPSPICLAKQLGSDGSQITVIVLPTDEAEMTQLGFVEQPCAGLDSNLADYRDKMCSVAQRTDSGFQETFYQSVGVSSEELCAKASALSQP